MENRRAWMLPSGGHWTAERDRDFSLVVSGYISILHHAQRYLRNNPAGRVICAFNPQLCMYKFDSPDPWDLGDWSHAYGDPRRPMSPTAMLRHYVMKNAEAGVNLLWPRVDDPSVPCGPCNRDRAVGRWLPREGTEGWTCPEGVWEETAGLIFPEVAALALAKCLQDPEFGAIIKTIHLDMPGWNHPWSTWPSREGGMPDWGNPANYWERWYSPVRDGTEEFFAHLAKLGVDLRYMVNQYGNGPIWGNLGQWPVDPIGAKLENYGDQQGGGRLRDNLPDHWYRYWDNTKDDPHWPDWRQGYNAVHETMGSAHSVLQIGGVGGAADAAHRRRWWIGTALLRNALVALQESWSDYTVPGRAECPEYYDWTENTVPAGDSEERVLKSGHTVWLRAYVDRDKPARKKLVVVNPHRTEEAGGVPPEDAVFLELWSLPFPEVMRWNAQLEGLEVRDGVSRAGER
jgi:hypothetical protein